jgi:MATE family multidrug resistance protein
VGNQKGLMDYVKLQRGAIHIFISNTSWDSVRCYIYRFSPIFTSSFVNVNDMEHVVETKEVIEIASQLLRFSNLRRNSSCCFRCFKRFTGCENTDVYYICGLLGSWFPISIYLGLYTDLKRLGFG